MKSGNIRTFSRWRKPAAASIAIVPKVLPAFEKKYPHALLKLAASVSFSIAHRPRTAASFKC